MRRADNLKSQLQPGCLYRRADLKELSRGVDRELAELVRSQVLVKVRHGLYECPRHSRFGLLPPDPAKLVRAFLKGSDFLLTSLNDFNSLGCGATQMHNFYLVYNHKRHGRFELCGQIYEFCIRSHYPKMATPEFLLVDLVNNLHRLAEDRTSILNNVLTRTPEMCPARLRAAIDQYSKASTRKFFNGTMRRDDKVADGE